MVEKPEETGLKTIRFENPEDGDEIWSELKILAAREDCTMPEMFRRVVLHYKKRQKG